MCVDVRCVWMEIGCGVNKEMVCVDGEEVYVDVKGVWNTGWGRVCGWGVFG